MKNKDIKNLIFVMPLVIGLPILFMDTWVSYIYFIMIVEGLVLLLYRALSKRGFK